MMRLSTKEGIKGSHPSASPGPDFLFCNPAARGRGLKTIVELYMS